MKNKIVLLLLITPLFVFAQKSSKGAHWEVGLNSTQLLRNLFAQNPTGLIGNYTFFVKKGSETNLFRAHFGGRLINKEESFDNQNQFLTTKFTEVYVGLGFEKRKTIYNKLQLVWGGDVLPSYTLDNSSTTFFVSSSGFKELENMKEIFGIGAGPILGLRYAFSKYFAISTESSLYVLYSQGENVTRESGAVIKNKKISKFAVSHSLPHSLYIVMNF